MMGQIIKGKDCIKYLGILTDKALSSSHHVKYVNLKLSKGIAILYKIGHYVSKKHLKCYIMYLSNLILTAVL